MTESSGARSSAVAYPKVATYFPETPMDSVTILNLGCGRSNSPISWQMLELPVLLVANLDIYRPDVEYLRRVPHRAQTVTFHIHDLRTPLPFGQNSFTMVVGIDVVEHLDARAALRLVREAERVAAKRVLFFVPLGPCPSFAEGKGNPYQAHQSVWWAHDLEMLGYNVDVMRDFHDFTTTTFDACFAWKDV